MLDGDNIKLSDFGWSTIFVGEKRRETQCGTLEYFPQEMILKKSYQPEVDLSSTGVLAYELVEGRSPFSDSSSGRTKMNIKKINYTFPNKFSNELR